MTESGEIVVVDYKDLIEPAPEPDAGESNHKFNRDPLQLFTPELIEIAGMGEKIFLITSAHIEIIKNRDSHWFLNEDTESNPSIMFCILLDYCHSHPLTNCHKLGCKVRKTHRIVFGIGPSGLYQSHIKKQNRFYTTASAHSVSLNTMFVDLYKLYVADRDKPSKQDQEDLILSLKHIIVDNMFIMSLDLEQQRYNHVLYLKNPSSFKTKLRKLHELKQTPMRRSRSRSRSRGYERRDDRKRSRSRSSGRFRDYRTRSRSRSRDRKRSHDDRCSRRNDHSRSRSRSRDRKLSRSTASTTPIPLQNSYNPNMYWQMPMSASSMMPMPVPYQLMYPGFGIPPMQSMSPMPPMQPMSPTPAPKPSLYGSQFQPTSIPGRPGMASPNQPPTTPTGGFNFQFYQPPFGKY